MDLSLLVFMVQAGAGSLMVWGIFCWHTFGPVECLINSFMDHNVAIFSKWFLEHSEFTILKRTTKLPDLNPAEHLCIVVEWEILIISVQPKNLQQAYDAIMSESLQRSILLNQCHQKLGWSNVSDLESPFPSKNHSVPTKEQLHTITLSSPLLCLGKPLYT